MPYKEDLLLVCNEEGKILNQKPNLDFGYDYIAGNCFIVGDDFENAGFKSVSEEQIEEIKQDLKALQDLRINVGASKELIDSWKNWANGEIERLNKEFDEL